jgi:cytidyltransferase-like protein
MISGLYTISELEAAIVANPQLWRPLVFTNGCFDIIHAGHVRYLQAAKSLGKSLVIGLNSDRSVQAIKSPHCARNAAGGSFGGLKISGCGSDF